VGLFNTLFWIVLSVSTFGGLINTVIRSIGSFEDGELKLSKAIAWFIRDVIAGLGAGFAAWLANQAMNNDAGMLFAAFLAGLAGVAAINQLLRAAGYKNERDLLTQAIVEENDIIEPLRDELKQTKDQLEVAEKQLQAANITLQIIQEREKLREQRLALPEAKFNNEQLISINDNSIEKSAS